MYSLEEKDMRLWLMNLVMLPAKALIPSQWHFPDKPKRLRFRLTWVIPSPLHSSSHSNFRVPFDGSK